MEMRTRKVGLLSCLLDYYSRAMIARRAKGLLRRTGRCTRTKPPATGEHSSVIIFFFTSLVPSSVRLSSPVFCMVHRRRCLAANYLEDLSRSLAFECAVLRIDRSIDRSTDRSQVITPLDRWKATDPRDHASHGTSWRVPRYLES